MELSTTFRLAGKACACPSSYKAVARALGGIKAYGQDTPIPLSKVLELLNLDDVLWCLRCTEQQAEADKLARLFVCSCAEHILPLFEKQYPEDKRPRQAIEAARKYANDEISLGQLRAAGAAAWAVTEAARAARDVGDAAWAVAEAAAYTAAEAAAWAAARDAAGAAAWEAARAARVAAAWAAAWEAAAWAAEREWQTNLFSELLKG